MIKQKEIARVSWKPAPAATAALYRAQNRPLRLGIVGCGAIAEHGYLPAIAQVETVSAHLLIDQNPARASTLAKQWQVPFLGRELTEAIGQVDAMIVATPNHLHAPMATELLRAGLPVLVEKPMALSARACDEMLEAAREGNAPLAVGFVCRYSHAARATRELLQNGCLGAVRSFYAENGGVFGWPVASDYLFRRETAGGGVLIDLGSHLIDLLVWWLGPVADLFHCDDSAGGVEADSLTHLRMETGASGKLRLSRTCRTRQAILLECERGSLCVHLGRPAIEIRLKDSGLHLDSEIREITAPNGSQTFVDLLGVQLTEWARAISAGRPFAADGRAGREVTAIIERCYAERRPWRLPWLRR